jgi:hypothetical protein
VRKDVPPKMIICYRQHIKWFINRFEAFEKFSHTNTGQIAVLYS